jgi:hypothetical protein
VRRLLPLALTALLATAACGGASETAEAQPGAGEHAGHGTSAGAEESHGPGDGHTDHVHLDIPDSGVGTLLGKGDGHGHRMREVDAAAAPAVRLLATADPAGGWTVQIPTERFRWTPQSVNSPAVAGAGHAHLYNGDTKVARVYSEWSFVPASAAEAGDTLQVVLYADDHTAWASAGRPVAAQVVLPAAVAA